eukprot:4851532-Ditylum_brightwellii.AAC.1
MRARLSMYYLHAETYYYYGQPRTKNKSISTGLSVTTASMVSTHTGNTMEVPAFVARKHSAAKIKMTSHKKQPIPNQTISHNFSSSPIKDPTPPPIQFTPDKTIQNEGKKISPPPHNKKKSQIVPPSTISNQDNSAGRMSNNGGCGWKRG